MEERHAERFPVSSAVQLLYCTSERAHLCAADYGQPAERAFWLLFNEPSAADCNVCWRPAEYGASAQLLRDHFLDVELFRSVA